MSGPQRFWWQTTKTPRFGFALGGGWAAVAVLQIVEMVSGTAATLTRLVTLGLATLLAVVYLLSAFRLRRRLDPKKD